MRIALVLALAVALSGCARDWLFKTQTVEVPVPVPCNQPMPTKPDFALDKAHPSDRLFVKGQATYAELLQRQAYERQLEDALTACRTVPARAK